MAPSPTAAPLDKSDLDPLFPDNPALLIHNSNHGASTPDPAGGVIVRRPGSREPAGVVIWESGRPSGLGAW